MADGRNVLHSYLEESRRHPPLSAEAEAETIARARQGDREARDLLIKSNLRFVIRTAREYEHRGIALDVLINEGSLALHEALERFDPARGTRFIVYAAWWIRNHMRGVIAEQSMQYSIPVKKMDLEAKMREAWAVFEQRHGRRPSVFEVAEELGVKESELVALIRLYSNFSIHLTDKESQGNRFQMPIEEYEDVRAGDAVITHLIRLEINAVLERMAPKDAEILRLYFGIGEDRKYTLEEIGKRFEVSRERVRQLKERALEYLRANAQNSKLEIFMEWLLNNS